MDIRLSEQYQAFRREVQAFLQENWQPTRDKAAITAFRRKAVGAGYLYRSIPKAYGGSEQPADVLKAHIIREEFAKAIEGYVQAHVHSGFYQLTRTRATNRQG